MSELGNAAQAGLKLSFFLPEPHEWWYVPTTMPSGELTVMRPVSHPYWTRQLGVALLNTFLESVLCAHLDLFHLLEAPLFLVCMEIDKQV